jgi:hypothetical protein
MAERVFVDLRHGTDSVTAAGTAPIRAVNCYCWLAGVATAGARLTR